MIKWIITQSVKRRDKALAISLYLFLCLIISCQPEQRSRDSHEPLFTMLSPESTGIDFANKIQENERQNFLTFPYYYNGGGVAVGDINADGLPDLYFTGNMVGDRLYVNKGNLQFEDITRKAGILQQNLWTTGVSFVDINNDGLLDIYVCRSGMRGFRNNLLYINQGNNKFTEQAKAYGLNDNGYSVQAYFFDYDIDGDLDMYLVNHSSKFFADQTELFSLKGKPEPDEADKLYRNDGVFSSSTPQIRFTEVSQEAGIRHFGFGLSASIEDFNADGFPDVYVANDFFEPDFLYINQRDGTFSNELEDYFGHTSFSSMGSDAADFNNDGLPDLMVCDMQAEDNYRKKAHMASMDTKRFARMLEEGYYYQYMQNILQLNTGAGRFSEIAELAGVDETDWSWGPLFFDMDNDGWKDLFVSNGIRRDIQYKDILTEVGQKIGGTRPPAAMDLIEHFPVERLSNYTFKNERNLTFSNQSQNWGIDFEGFSTGAAYADLDMDGDLDLVLNNLDDLASIYENQTRQYTGANYIQVKLIGKEDNTYGIGARIEIYTDSSSRYQYMQTTRGFQSAIAPSVHVGIGNEKTIKELKVRWPNGTHTIMRNISVNQSLSISQEDTEKSPTEVLEKPIFSEITSDINLNHQHREILYDDFAKEVLLPHKYSQLGPRIATADVNGDGLDDFYIGGAKDFSGKLFLQTTSGKFETISQATWDQDKSHEDIDAAFFDSDGDGDLDLYVVSGSNEWDEGSTMYQDRLYTNNGDGKFTRNKNALPTMDISGACVRPGDFDKDGDIDLFIGGRIVPGKYPLPARSYLLRNEGDKFLDITEEICQDLISLGLVSDALWTDYDNDGNLDLMIVGEWMPITVFQNHNGKSFTHLNIQPFTHSHGWWYSLATADIDKDGDMDYLVGNVGLNYKYQASEKEPFHVYASDFDENGSLDIVLGYFNQGELYPLRGKQCSSEQMPFITEKFPQYTMFASATLEEVYGAENLESATHYEATKFASVYIENQGEGQFEMVPLPQQAQFSAINEFITTDVDEDGHLDVLLAGNMFQSEVETARNDAGAGLLLKGDGRGNFLPIPAYESGFFAPGDVKCLAKLKSVNGKELFLVGNNNGVLQIFSRN